MDNLSKLTQRERARLVTQTTVSGNVSKDDFDALDRLEKLAAGDRSWHQWWIPACAFLLPLAAVTFLITKDQKQTEIDLDAKVSAFSATLKDKQPLFNGSLLRAFSASGLEGIDKLSAEDGDCSLDMKLGAKPLPEEAINLQLLEVPRGWRVFLEHSESSIEVTLSGPATKPETTHEDVPTTVSVSGRATLETRCGGVRNLRESKAKDISSVTLRVGPRTTLSVTPVDGRPLRFARQIAVEKVAFVSQEISFADAPLNRQLSSVLSGTLYLNALDGKQVPLRPAEALSFSDFTGTLRRITPATDGLQLELFGTVQGMKTGEAPNQRSLMPTYLQWVAARKELWLWWGSAVSAFAVLMSVLRWLKITT
jgi:hypothetical protein